MGVVGGVSRGLVAAFALAGALAIMEHHHCPEGGLDAAWVIRQRGRHAGRWPVGSAGDAAQSAQCLTDDAESGTVAVRPGLSEAADAHHDETRICLVNLFVTEAPLLQLTGAEILDHHIALHHQSANDVTHLLRYHVDEDTPLVAVRYGPHQELAVVVATNTRK